MKYLKLLLKYIFNTELSKKIRNISNIRPIHVSLPFHLNKISISDAFPWRTNDDFETIFRFSDIPKKYLQIHGTGVLIEFFNKDGNFLKKIELQNLKTVNELIISKKTLELEDFGSFYIYHILPDDIKIKFMITNRCYVGFSSRGGNPSFVHGNTYAKYYNPENKVIKTNLVNKSLFKREYNIQTSLFEYDKVELFFTNPTNNKINFKVNGFHVGLNGGSSAIINVTKEDKIKIKSNLYMLRPLIFTKKGSFIDCFHA